MCMGEPRKVYVTKYAYAQGVLCCTVNERWTGYCDKDSGRIYVDWAGGSNGVLGIGAGDWHDTLDAAQARVRETAESKLKGLNKQRSRLSKLALDGAKVVEK